MSIIAVPTKSGVAAFPAAYGQGGAKGDPGSPGEGYATRSAMAARSAPALLDDVYLTEVRREGKFVVDAAASWAAEIAADTAAAIFVPSSADAAKVYRRVDASIYYRPEWFGAVGDGVTDDADALIALAAQINADGGGVIECRKGATYAFAPGQTYHATPAEVIYNWPPAHKFLLELHGLTTPLIIHGNGARIRCLSGGKFGVFNSDGSVNATADGYMSTGVGTPYNYMLYIHDCTSSVRVENLELDGNIAGQTIGGHWGDTGWQLPNTGMLLENNAGGVIVGNVNSHHHGLDGLSVNGAATSEASDSERGFVSNSKFDYNGRLGISFVGGRGWKFKLCDTNWNGNTSATGSTVSSGPAAGIDIEAEGGKYVRDLTFELCVSVGNQFQQIVAASGPTKRVACNDCCFVSTVAASNTIVPARPYMTFKRCLLAGTAVSLWRNVSNPAENVAFEECTFSNSNEHSPTGTTECTSNLVVDAPVAGGIPFNRCTFDFNKSGTSANFSTDDPYLIDCTVTARAGFPAVNGRYIGKTELIETGSGVIQTTPGGGVAPLPFKGNSGQAEEAWAYTTVADGRAVYPATISKATNDVLGVGTNSADAAATLTPGTDRQSQRFTGTLTADRAVTLSTTGAKSGSRFRISRTGGGAFNLNVGTGPLKALATNTWAEFEYDIAGPAWRLLSSGSL